MEDEVTAQEIIEQSKATLILRSYQDIFSSFDPRPYNERTLSDDFLIENKKIVAKMDEVGELQFLVPQKQRNAGDEKKINQRLKEHYKRHAKIENEKFSRIKMRGAFLFIFGALLSFTASFISPQTLITRFIGILLEPAGWFTIWTGLDDLLFYFRKKRKVTSFYQKMSGAKITFASST